MMCNFDMAHMFKDVLFSQQRSHTCHNSLPSLAQTLLLEGQVFKISKSGEPVEAGCSAGWDPIIDVRYVACRVSNRLH
jgi:hypothetical protein